MRGHIGAYIGTVTKGVNTYNVIECTTSWGGGVIYSWVDSDGTRRKCKGGQASRKWESHGKMTKWVSYESDPKKKTNEEIAKWDVEYLPLILKSMDKKGLVIFLGTFSKIF